MSQQYICGSFMIVGVDDPRPAAEFYAELLDGRVTRKTKKDSSVRLSGSHGSMMFTLRAPQQPPTIITMLTFDLTPIIERAAKLDPQPALASTELPFGTAVSITDPSGNTLWMLEVEWTQDDDFQEAAA